MDFPYLLCPDFPMDFLIQSIIYFVGFPPSISQAYAFHRLREPASVARRGINIYQWVFLEDD